MSKLGLYSALLVQVLLGGCQPGDRCGDGLVFYGGSCRPCPTKSTFQDGTCACDQPDYFHFEGFACVLISDANLPPMDSSSGNDAGEVVAGTCGDYCTFLGTCLAANSLAAIAMDVIGALHADDATMCTAQCTDDVGGAGADDEALQCITSGVEASMCTTLQSTDGLTATFTLIGNCCDTRRDNALCRDICTALKANPAIGPMVTFCD